MVLKQGEKVHVVTRRRFEGDLRRHFVGEVQAATESTARIDGYVFIFDAFSNKFVKGSERGVRIFGLVDSGNIISIIPQSVNVEKVSYQIHLDNRLVLTDGESFQLDINEFSAYR